MENNALGLLGLELGGKLVIENSLFRHNSAGIAPNSENPGDGPPPQDGECGRPNIENPNPTPIITTTKITRCTIIPPQRHHRKQQPHSSGQRLDRGRTVGAASCSRATTPIWSNRT